MSGHLSCLSDDELSIQLKLYGESVGPITSSTRILYERKLWKHLHPLPAGEEELDQKDSSGSQTLTPSNMSCHEPTTPVRDESAKSTSQACIFAVQLPAELIIEEGSEDRIFNNKEEVLKLMKKYPGSRFKTFNNRSDAMAFLSHTPDTPLTPAQGSTPSSSVNPESSLFKAPKIQELVLLRKAIEGSDVRMIVDLVKTNPRYLVSSGDAPTILQEGFRYNALHVAALKNRAAVCQVIIDILESEEFWRTLYPDDSNAVRANRIKYTVDMYLNTPDKGNCENPLHFACKFGYVQVVSILASHPCTDKQCKNKFNETPKEVIGQRTRNLSASLKEEICNLLEEQCYIPLLRSEDNTQQAKVAPPWTPTSLQNAAMNMHGSPKESTYSTRAYAGPTTPDRANDFRQTWLKPPSSVKVHCQNIRRTDTDKGLERIGRNLAHKMDIPWKEYWHFLDCFTDLSTDEGLQLLENYLIKRTREVRQQITLDNDLKSIEDQLNYLTLKDSSLTGMDWAMLDKTSCCTSALTDHRANSSTMNNNQCCVKDMGSRDMGDTMVSNRGHEANKSVDNKVNPSALTNEYCGEHQATPIPMTPLDDLSDSSSYCTALDDLDLDYEEADANGDIVDVFLIGNEMTKSDIDVLYAVQDSCLIENYPHVCHWRNFILSFPEQFRNRFITSRRSKPRQDQKSHLDISYSNSPTSPNTSFDDHNDSCNEYNMRLLPLNLNSSFSTL